VLLFSARNIFQTANYSEKEGFVSSREFFRIKVQIINIAFKLFFKLLKKKQIPRIRKKKKKRKKGFSIPIMSPLSLLCSIKEFVLGDYQISLDFPPELMESSVKISGKSRSSPCITGTRNRQSITSLQMLLSFQPLNML